MLTIRKVFLCAIFALFFLQPSRAAETNASPSLITAKLATAFVLKPGEEAEVAGENLTVTFTKVANDSRCPSGAQCAWEGNARIKVLLARSADDRAGVDLNTVGRSDLPNQATQWNYTIKLVELTPYPKLSPGIAQADYRAKFVVSKP